jgi:hypothetical protein
MAGDERWEEFKVKGEEALAKVKELVREGNVRRLIIANDEARRWWRSRSPSAPSGAVP